VAAAPTTICSIPRLDGLYLLTGARPSDLLRRLDQIADDDYDIAVHPPQHQDGIGPSTVFVEGELDQIMGFATAADLQFELLAGPRLAKVLPTLDVDLLADRAHPDRSFPHAPVDHETGRPHWNSGERPSSDGLWLFGSRTRRRTYYLCIDGEWWHVPTDEYGVYLARAVFGEKRPAIAYDPIDQHLLVSRRAPLPRSGEFVSQDIRPETGALGSGSGFVMVRFGGVVCGFLSGVVVGSAVFGCGTAGVVASRRVAALGESWLVAAAVSLLSAFGLGRALFHGVSC
jgi:hypothetical protein